MKSKHSSDEQLLALMDGELSAWSALRVRRHLRSCWECRARLTRLENAAHSLAEARQRSRFLPESRVESARSRFLNRAAPQSTSEVRWAVAWSWKHAVALTFAGVISLASAVGVWRAGGVTVPPAPVRVVSPVRTMPPARVADPVTVPRVVTPPPIVVPTELEVARIPSHLNEVEAWRVIHELGLCRGQNVKIEGGHLTGVVATASRRDEVIARMKEAGVSVVSELRTIEELAGVEGSHATSERVARVIAPGEALVHDWLKKQGERDVALRVNEISNQSVTMADLAWAEAWAIRDLTERFGPLSKESEVVLMLRDHQAELRRLALRQRQVLAGVLPLVHSSGGDLHEETVRWNSAIQRLFAPSEPVDVAAEDLILEVARALSVIEAGDVVGFR